MGAGSRASVCTCSDALGLSSPSHAGNRLEADTQSWNEKLGNSIVQSQSTLRAEGPCLIDLPEP
eukprot:3009767-Pyramimonas_sp.AAC.1